MSDSAATGILALKPVALKRKAVAHSDKVRYRVYVDSQEFVAVIAENALMAMKISGVKAPHRIVRDLPLTHATLEDSQLTPHHLQPTMLLRPEMESPSASAFQPIPINTDTELKPFLELSLSELHSDKQLMASTIDVSVLLNALPGETLAVTGGSDPLSPPMELVPEPEVGLEPAADPALSPEEVEQLLNEPRA